MNSKQNRIFQVSANLIMALLSIACIVPFVLLFVSSFTDESAIIKYGYSFFPKVWSSAAYYYLWTQSSQVFHAYGITVFNTIVGTTAGLTIASMLAYPLSRKDFPLHRALTFIVFFTLLFNGGLVPTYLIYTQIFHIKNTIWGLIIPGLLMNGFNVLLIRTFFTTNIPGAVIESAKIDGAGEVKTFIRIILPLSLPIMATVGLMTAVIYWNDWYNGLIYITKPNLYSLQNLLNRMLMDVQFLQNNSSLSSNAGSIIAKLPSATVKMAIAVIGVFPIMAAYPFFQKYFIKGITIGAVKG